MCKVLMIAPTPFFADRGCHVRILGEIRALERAGCEVTLCTYHNGRDMPGVRTVRIPRVPWYSKLEAGPSSHKYYLDFILMARALVRAAGDPPDVVHAHLHEGAMIGWLVSRMLRKPLLFDSQGSLSEELIAHRYIRRGTGPHRVMARLERFIDSRPDAIAVSSGRAARELGRREGGAPVEPILDGVDTEMFRPIPEDAKVAVRREYALPEESVLALYVGVLAPYQGIDLLLDHVASALESDPALHLAVVGFPHEAYERRVREAGLGERISFLGRVPFEETARLTAAADMALAPKISRTEGNLKIYNYMSCGLPVVAFDNSVNREILDDTGVLVPMEDGDAYVREMAALAAHPARRDLLGRRARERAVAELSWDGAARKLIRTYRRIGASVGDVAPVKLQNPPERPSSRKSSRLRSSTSTAAQPH